MGKGERTCSKLSYRANVRPIQRRLWIDGAPGFLATRAKFGYNAGMINSSQYARINGIRMAYEKTGNGFPLLLLHGFPRTHRTWSYVTPALAERFSVLAPDRRGYGDSDRSSDPATYDNTTMASDALELTRHLGWDRFLVAGHDKGVATARRLAADYPEAVAGAIMMDIAPERPDSAQRRDPTGRTWYLDFFRQRGVAEAIINANPRLFFSLFLDRNPHLTPEEHEFYVQMFCRRGTVDAILADYRASAEVDRPYWEEQAKAGHKIQVPIYVLWGARGPSANTPMVDAWQQVADNVQGEVVPNSAHYIQEEQPEFVVQQIMRFADSLGIS